MPRFDCHFSLRKFSLTNSPTKWGDVFFCSKVRRAYQSSWNSRCQVLFCCVKTSKGKNEVRSMKIDEWSSSWDYFLAIRPEDHPAQKHGPL